MSSKTQERTKERVADAMELMEETIRRQDKVVEACAGQTKRTQAMVADTVKIASHADDKAASALTAINDLERRMLRIEAMTLTQRLQWFFRGQLP